jgi:outer membrane protein assembly factor BamB
MDYHGLAANCDRRYPEPAMRLKPILFSVALLVLSTIVVAADPSWPTFRGKDRTGVSKETGLLQSWPAEGPKLLWEAAGVGRGYSSLAIADGRIYTMGDGSSLTEDKDEYLFCFDQAKGELIWKSKTGPAWTGGQESWQSSRSTPTVDGKHVYILTAEGDLICFETDKGAEKWRKNLKKDFGGDKGDKWGYSESVTIDGDKLVCLPGKEKNTMVALNKETGELIWSASQPGNKGAGHASILITDIGPTRAYASTTASGALGVRASDGKLLWTYDIRDTTAVIPTPIAKGDLFFLCAGYKLGGALLKQVPADGNEVKVEEVYPIRPNLANKHGGVILVGDYLYGDSEDQGIPFCADFMTGEEKWKKRGSGKGSASFTAADGCLYIHFASGTMVLAKASPDKYEEISSFSVPHSGSRPSWAHPVILDGKLYLREQDHILCYDIKTK